MYERADLQVKAKKKLNALFVLACARGYLDDVSSSNT